LVLQLIGVGLEIIELPFIELVEVHELVALRPHSVVPRYHVDAGILVVMVIDAFAPVFRGFTAENGHQRNALQIRGTGKARDFEEGGSIVKILHHERGADAGRSDTGPFYDERHFEGFFIHPSLVIPSMITNVETLIGGVDHEGVFS
jgi:hypothetical protein